MFFRENNSKLESMKFVVVKSVHGMKCETFLIWSCIETWNAELKKSVKVQFEIPQKQTNQLESQLLPKNAFEKGEGEKNVRTNQYSGASFLPSLAFHLLLLFK